MYFQQVTSCPVLSYLLPIRRESLGRPGLLNIICAKGVLKWLIALSIICPAIAPSLITYFCASPPPCVVKVGSYVYVIFVCMESPLIKIVTIASNKVTKY